MGKTYDKLSDFDRIGGGVGKAVAAADFALSAGFGTTASIAVAAGSTATRGEATITSAGTGQAANPTCTFTPSDGAFDAAPFPISQRNGGSQLTIGIQPTTRNAGSIVYTFQGTPVAAETYKFVWHILA